MMRYAKPAIPWPAKIAAKLVLARLPVPHRVWKRLGIFEHSEFSAPDYVQVALRHYNMVRPIAPFTCLELGPGDTLASALVMAALGAERTYLVDVGEFADRDLATYHGVAQTLRQRGFEPPEISKARNLEDVLDRCRAVYLTEGVASLQRLTSASVDFIWSHAVLEHVRRWEFGDVVAELHRIARPGSLSSHVVDLEDHLSGSLNSLRFTDQLWESNFFASSGFYTNRIRHRQMLEIFRRAGFTVVKDEPAHWDRLPVRRQALASAFRSLPDEDLRVSGFTALLRAAAHSP
jgi:Methyltransferase domain